MRICAGDFEYFSAIETTTGSSIKFGSSFLESGRSGLPKGE